MDILANVKRSFVGKNTGLTFWYKPMPQTLKNHIQEVLAADSIAEIARIESNRLDAEMAGDPDKKAEILNKFIMQKIGDSMYKNKLSNETMTIRTCLLGITDAEGPVMMGDVCLDPIPRVMGTLGGLPSSLMDADILGAILNGAPAVGEDLWSLAKIIHEQPTVEEKKS